MIIVNDKQELKDFVREIIQELENSATLKAEHRKLYRKNEAAKKMGISLSYLYRLIDTGAIPTVNDTFISGEIIDWFTGIGKTTEKEKKEIVEFLSKYRR